MTAFFLMVLAFFAYGVLCAFFPEKHLGFNAWLNRKRRREWHKYRAYTPAGLRMERRWSQQTPANLWGMRITGIAFIAGGLWVLWEYWKLHH